MIYTAEQSAQMRREWPATLWVQLLDLELLETSHAKILNLRGINSSPFKTKPVRPV